MLAIDCCTRVIESGEGTASALRAKALFRRGAARTEMSDFDAAKADLRQASVLEPASKEVRDQFAMCKERELAARRVEDDAQRGVFAKMFSSDSQS